MPRPLRLALTGVAALCLAGVVWFALQAVPLGGSGRLVIVEVRAGESLSQITSSLAGKGVVASGFALRLDFALLGAPTVRPGAYQLAQGSSFSKVKSVLGSGPNVPSVTVYPGMTVHEVALLLAQDEGNAYATGFLAATRSAAAASAWSPDLSPPALASAPGAVNPLEGLIGPGTYLIAPGESPATLLAAMQRSFAREAAAAGLSATTHVEGLSAYQLLTAASIVEREGYYARNMGKVARVVLNRLARHSSLQMDSTIKYPLGMDSGAVTSSMLATVSPYNTYLVAGLTPTPICTVSAQALAATLHPPAGPWLYFVVINKAGDEAFATTYAEQLANEARARANGVG